MDRLDLVHSGVGLMMLFEFKNRQTVIFIFGGPGGGKGPSEVDRLDLVHSGVTGRP